MHRTDTCTCILALPLWRLSTPPRRFTRRFKRPDGRMLARRRAGARRRGQGRPARKSEPIPAVLAMDSVGEPSRLAGQSAPAGLDHRQAYQGHRRNPPLQRALCSHRRDQLQLYEDNIERRISEGTGMKKNQERMPRAERRRIVACDSRCSAAAPDELRSHRPQRTRSRK